MALKVLRKRIEGMAENQRIEQFLREARAAAKSNGPKLDKDQPFPPNTLDSALFWWSGRKKDRPMLFATVPDMKIEAICRLGTSRFIAIGSDEGDVSEGREQRQSVLTILEFTGVKGAR